MSGMQTQLIKKTAINESGDFNLSASRYLKKVQINSEYEFVQLKDHISVLSGFAFKSGNFNSDDGIPLIRIRDIKPNKTKTFYKGEFDQKYLIKC